MDEATQQAGQRKTLLGWTLEQYAKVCKEAMALGN